MFCSLLVRGLQHNRLLCPPLPPRVCSNPCPMSQSCYLTISSSATPFSFCLQSFPPSGSFPISWIFASGSQSTGASASILSMNIQGWFPLGRTSGVSVCLSLNWVGKLICKLSCGFSNLWSLNKNVQFQFQHQFHYWLWESGQKKKLSSWDKESEHKLGTQNESRQSVTWAQIIGHQKSNKSGNFYKIPGRKF